MKYDDEECYDKYWMNPLEMEKAETGVFDQPTEVLEKDVLSYEQLEKIAEMIRMDLDWKQLSKAASQDFPGIRYMMERNLRRAFNEPRVRNKLIEFINVLTQTADRRMLNNPMMDICGECGGSGSKHASWCPLKGSADLICGECGESMNQHAPWCPFQRKPLQKRKKALKKKTKKKTRKNPSRLCKGCKKPLKVSPGRGRPRQYHPKCRKR